MSQTFQDGEFHRADPDYRRTMKAWLFASIVGGAIVLVALNLWMNRLYSTLALTDISAYQTWMSRLLAGLSLLIAAGMAVFGLWLKNLAKQTRIERRWPPSAMKTSTDIRIRYLTSADSLVQQMQAASWALWSLAAGLSAWAGWLLFRS